jgi:hypothetical protein
VGAPARQAKEPIPLLREQSQEPVEDFRLGMNSRHERSPPSFFFVFDETAFSKYERAFINQLPLEAY